MNAFAELWRAVLGWLDLLTLQPDAADKFTLTPTGLINATGFYIALSVLLVAAETQMVGFPGWTQVAINLASTFLRLLAIWVVIWATVRLAGGSFTALAVPATYAMGFVFALTLPFAFLLGDSVVLVMLGIRAFLFYRAARVFAPYRVGISAAFAILCVVALAVLPIGLYMLTGGGQPVG